MLIFHVCFVDVIYQFMNALFYCKFTKKVRKKSRITQFATASIINTLPNTLDRLDRTLIGSVINLSNQSSIDLLQMAEKWQMTHQRKTCLVCLVICNNRTPCLK